MGMTGRVFRAAVAAGALTVAACSGGDEQPVDTTGFDLLASQNYAAAEAYYTNEVAQDPSDASAHLNLGAAHEAQGNFAMAARHYQLAVQYGEGVPVGQTAFNGQVKSEETTVAAVAAYNLANLPQ